MIATRATLLFALIFILASTPAGAAQINIPHVFINGAVADADSVNENFDVLATESNAQDTRISALEAAVRQIDVQTDTATRTFGTT